MSSHIPPFNLTFDGPLDYCHDMFPNRMYRRLHARHHDPLGLYGLGLIARLGAHAHNLVAKRNEGDLSVISGTLDKKDLQLHLDVGLFQPGELTVKVIDDYVVIEGKHEEREDEHGCVSRHFRRRYLLPKGYDADKIESTFSSDGVLTVKMPRQSAVEHKANEKVIPIQEVGPNDLFVRSSPSQPKSDPAKDK